MYPPKKNESADPEKQVSFKLPKGQSRLPKEEKASHSQQKVFRIYENNWDLKTINKLSKNCSRWLVYEVMRGQKGEYRDKLKKNYQDNFGSTMSTTELLPEAISETDLNDFYQDCRDFGIDLERLNRAGFEQIESVSERMTLRDLAVNRVERRPNIEIKDDILELNRTCQDVQLYPFRAKTAIGDGDTRKNQQSSKGPRFIPTVLPLQTAAKNNPALVEEIRSDEPVAAIALKQWQATWESGGKWFSMTIKQLRESLTSIQDTIREDAVSSLASMVVCARQVRGLDDQSEILLPAGIKDKVVTLLEDGNSRIRLAGASCVLTIPIPEQYGKIRKLLLKTIDEDQEVPNTFFASILLTMLGVDHTDAKICKNLMEGYLLSPRPYLLHLMANLSSKCESDLVHSVIAEYLNSGTLEERSAACTVISHLDSAKLRAPLVEKLVHLAWDDQQEKVRLAAIAALGRTGRHDKVLEYVYSQLVDSLDEENMSFITLKALDWLQEVGIVTERLLAAMIGCFSSHYGSVRKKICETVGELELAEAEVIQQLILLIKREAISKIKQAAIHALAKTGKRTDDKIKKCLARTVRFEDDPVVRCTAAQTILDMNIFNNEEVVSVIKERIVVEPDSEVQRILALILEKLNLTVEQVLESHPLLVQIKSDIQTLVQSENVIPIICAQRRKA